MRIYNQLISQECSFRAPPSIPYIYYKAFLCTLADMERPRTVLKVAKLFNTSIEQLPLRCNFCGRHLRLFDKLFFEKHSFQVKWLGNEPFACCQRCLRICGGIEFKLYFQRNLLAEEIRASTGAPIWFQQIRCRRCLRPLTKREKVLLQKRREFVYEVRGRLRAHCTLCRLSFCNA